MRPGRARDGFTLIETVVALGLTAVVLASLAVAVPTALRASRNARARLTHDTTTRTVLLHLEREVATALDDPVVVTTTPPRLELTGGAEPGERIVYTLDGTTLVRRATPRFATAPATQSGIVVLPDVAALELRAFDGREWVAQWHEAHLPEAVRIHLVFADGDVAEGVMPVPIARRRGRS